MAGRQIATHCGLEFRVGPDFWLRRFLRFPFYFESTNPSFRVDIKRVSDAKADQDWPYKLIRFQILFADQTLAAKDFDIPDLRIGQSTKLVLKNVYTSYPGQTIISLPTNLAIAGFRSEQWHTLYSYRVREEEQLYVWMLAPLAVVLFSAATTTLSVFIQRWLG